MASSIKNNLIELFKGLPLKWYPKEKIISEYVKRYGPVKAETVVRWLRKLVEEGTLKVKYYKRVAFYRISDKFLKEIFVEDKMKKYVRIVPIKEYIRNGITVRVAYKYRLYIKDKFIGSYDTKDEAYEVARKIISGSK